MPILDGNLELNGEVQPVSKSDFDIAWWNEDGARAPFSPSLAILDGALFVVIGYAESVSQLGDFVVS